MAARQSALLEVALVVIFGGIKGRRSGYLRDDWPSQLSARLESRLRCFRCRFLLGTVVEDRRAVLGANVRPLPVQCGGIMVFPEHIEQPVVGDLSGIVLDLHHFGMTGPPGAYILISRICESST